MDTETITAALAEPFPQSLIEEKQGKSYIAAEHVRMRLIEATGNRFDFAVQSMEIRNDGALRDRTDRSTGEVIPTPVCVVVGTLTIPGLGSRTDVGVQEIQAGGGADAAYKGAQSDCLKRCAMDFGVGLKQLYIDGGKTPAPTRNYRDTETPQTASRRPSDQNRPEPSPLGPTDDEFAQLVKDAVKSKDGKKLAALIPTAGTVAGRWLAIISTVQNIDQVAWVERQMENRGIIDPALLDAVKIRRGELTEAA
jgi:hypothetical protein